MQVLSYKVPGFPVRSILGSIVRMLIAAALMAEVVWLVTQQVGGNVGIDALVRVVVGALIGLAVYLGLLYAMGAPELDAVRHRLRPEPA
jgi:putative peptidoglycan lipid II flippase